MRWPRLAIVAALGVAWIGCGSDEPETTPGQPAVTEDSTTAPPAAEPASEPVAQEAPPRQTAAPSTTRATDEPWTPVYTGTVNPGMTRDEVVGVWGEPVTERAAGGRTYMYFRNGCEISCGTHDVVFLEGGQVVDAIVRGPGHVYSGISSSPPERQAQPTLPGAPGNTGVS